MYPDIKAMVDDYIESVTDDREPDGAYHPSSMYGCDRKTMYEVRGVEPTDPTDAKAKRRFYIGHRLHEAVQRALESHVTIGDAFFEFLVDAPPYNTLGHGDAIIEIDGLYYLVEVKSIKKMGVKMGLPKEDHVKQAVTYWWCVQKYGFTIENWEGNTEYIGPTPLAGIIMLYVEKEDLNIYQYNLEPEDWWDVLVPETVARLDTFREDELSLPPRLPRNPKTGKKHWLCGYCPFATKCWKVDPAEVLAGVEFDEEEW